MDKILMQRASLRFVKSAIVVALIVLFFGTVSQADPPVIAKAITVEGAVTVFLAGEKFGRRVTAKTSFAEGDRIVTGAKSAIVVQFKNGIRIRIDESSEMIVRAN
jgi:hypothetical protein